MHPLPNPHPYQPLLPKKIFKFLCLKKIIFFLPHHRTLPRKSPLLATPPTWPPLHNKNYYFNFFIRKAQKKFLTYPYHLFRPSQPPSPPTTPGPSPSKKRFNFLIYFLKKFQNFFLAPSFLSCSFSLFFVKYI